MSKKRPGGFGVEGKLIARRRFGSAEPMIRLSLPKSGEVRLKVKPGQKERGDYDETADGDSDIRTPETVFDGLRRTTIGLSPG